MFIKLQAICVECKETFTLKYRNQIYCSKKCYRSYHNKKQRGKRKRTKKGVFRVESKRCFKCKELFKPSIITQKYCSIECRRNQQAKVYYWKHHNELKLKNRKYQKERRKKLAKALKPMHTYTCKECEVTFMSERNKKYCSNKCAHRRASRLYEQRKRKRG